MKRTLSLLLALCISTMLFADNFVMIKVKDQQNLRELFSRQDINIHYYNDNYVLATTETLNEDMILLDENSFDDNELYFIVYCDKSEQANYIERERENAEVLFATDDYLIVKQLSYDLEPAKNDGMVAIYNKTSRLPKVTRDFPVVSEEDATIKELMNEVDIENLTATVQHLQDYERRQYNTTQAEEAAQWLYTQFEDLGLDVEEFPFDYLGNPSSPNIIATQWGTKFPDKYIICGSHYDSHRSGDGDKTCPGADDNATGVATVLETARILSEYSFEYSILYLSSPKRTISNCRTILGSSYCLDLCLYSLYKKCFLESSDTLFII